MDEPPLMTPAEVAALFRVTKTTVSEWAAKGVLPGIQLGKGRTLRFRRADVEKLLEPTGQG